VNKQLLDSLCRTAWDSVSRAASIEPFIDVENTGKLLCTSWRSNGFSDAVIYRLETDLGDFAIRSWPNRFDTPSKVEFWSSTNQSFTDDTNSLTLVGAANQTPFPQLVEWCSNDASAGPILPYADKLWTLCQWVTGKPLESNGVSKSTVEHLATVLGRLHSRSNVDMRVSSSLAGNQTMRSNSLRERLDLLKSMDYRLLSSCDPTHFFTNNQLLEKVKHCLAIMLERQPSWLRFLTICESQNRNCHWIVRDLWSENILVDERQRFSSIVDLGAARLDWPGLDFVRLFGSLSYGAGDRTILAHDDGGEDLWKDAYHSYTQSHNEHTIESLDECKMLHKVSLGLSIVQWVLWSKAGSIDLNNADKVQRVTNRIAALCDQMLVEAV
jgi:hypothetical protein